MTKTTQKKTQTKTQTKTSKKRQEEVVTGFSATLSGPVRRVITRKWDWYYVGDKRKKLYFT